MADKEYIRRICPRCGEPQIGVAGTEVWWHDEDGARRDGDQCSTNAMLQRIHELDAEVARLAADKKWIAEAHRKLGKQSEEAHREVARLTAENHRLWAACVGLVSAHPCGHQPDDLVRKRLASGVDTLDRSSLRALLDGRAALAPPEPEAGKPKGIWPVPCTAQDEFWKAIEKLRSAGDYEKLANEFVFVVVSWVIKASNWKPPPEPAPAQPSGEEES